MEPLTTEQEQLVADLQAEITGLQLQADERFAQYIKTGKRECYDEVLALDSEVEMKGLIAYMPKVGEGKVSRVRGLIQSIKQAAGVPCPECELPHEKEARLDALRTVNMWRESIGLPLLDRLPRGIMGDSTECTLARAISTGWEGTGLSLSDVKINGNENMVVWTDQDGIVREYDFPEVEGWETVVSKFDDALYPDLIEDDAIGTAVAAAITDVGRTLDSVAVCGLLAEAVDRGIIESVILDANEHWSDGTSDLRISYEESAWHLIELEAKYNDLTDEYEEEELQVLTVEAMYKVIDQTPVA